MTSNTTQSRRRAWDRERWDQPDAYERDLLARARRLYLAVKEEEEL